MEFSDSIYNRNLRREGYDEKFEFQKNLQNGFDYVACSCC